MDVRSLSQPTNRNEIARILRADISRRSDVGIVKAVLNLVLEPQNPFDSTKRRQPRKLAVLSALVLIAAFACFAYFNLAG
jgi:hypothetical protein